MGGLGVMRLKADTMRSVLNAHDKILASNLGSQSVGDTNFLDFGGGGGGRLADEGTGGGGFLVGLVG